MFLLLRKAARLYRFLLGLREPAALAGVRFAVKFFEQFFLLFSEFGWRIYNDSYNVCTTRSAAQVWDTVVRQLKIGSTLRAGRYLHADWAINGFNGNFST